MVDNSPDPQLSCFLNGETMDSYIEQSQMQSLGAWATGVCNGITYKAVYSTMEYCSHNY